MNTADASRVVGRGLTWGLALLLSACTGPGAAAPTPALATSTPRSSPVIAPSATTVFVPLVETANPPAVGWQARAQLPTARTEVAATVLGGRIYVAGGYAADGSTLDVVEVYDPAVDIWATAAPLPAGRNHMGLAALDGRLYTVSGYGGPISASAASADVWVYDPVTNSWLVAAPLPAPRAAHALVAETGRLYLVGGVGPETRTTLVYNPATDVWSALSPIPTEREHLAAAVLDGRTYAVAGRAGG